MSKSIALIIGSGKNIGASTAKMLHARGYLVAQAARSLRPEDSTDNELLIRADLTRPDSVTEAFEAVRRQWGEPSVVLYNAAAVHFTPPEGLFDTPPKDFADDLTINTTSVYAAAKEAVAGFRRLPDSAAKTFFYTGNGLNTKVMPALLTLGVGKAATAHLIASASMAFSAKSYRFYYVDERKTDGSFASNDISGPGHAAFFATLIDGGKNVPWHATFVTNEGYRSFD